MAMRVGRLVFGCCLLLAVAAPAPALAVSPRSAVSGTLRADGPFFHDSAGRAVILRGVNAVSKIPPYHFDTGPGGAGANQLTDADATQMAGFGFNIVRLGVIWKGLEPGRHGRGRDDPAICSRGTPADPGEFDQATADAYLAHVAATVDILAAHGIYSLLDMHQDVYNEAFNGEGAPDWAVCTGDPVTGTPVAPDNRQSWNQNYSEPAVVNVFNHFWNNDVVGDLQGEYDRALGALAARFHGNQWVIGYDLFNEPFSAEIYTAAGAAEFDQRLKCAYAGRAHQPANACPPGVPADGMIPALRHAGSTQMVFYEPDVSADFGNPSFIGPIPFDNLVLNFHDYCLVGGTFGSGSGNTPDCNLTEPGTFSNKSRERQFSASAEQPHGPGWFLSEFGASDDLADISRMATLADQNLIGWTYWAWKQYHDPTGSADHLESMFAGDVTLKPEKAALLVRTYAQAVAGTPTAMSFDPGSGDFRLQYQPDQTVTAPTEVFVPVAMHYPNGYCATAAGARITSAPNAVELEAVNQPGAGEVTITIAACPAGNAASGGNAASAAGPNSAQATTLPFTGAGAPSATAAITGAAAGGALLLLGLGGLRLHRRRTD